MARLRMFLPLVCAAIMALTGCSASSEDGPATADGAEEEIRSVATSFFQRTPLSSAKLERLSTELSKAEDGYSWVRNQGGAFGMQWETEEARPLEAADRASLAQAAFAFQHKSKRKFLKNLEVVAPTDEELGKALDAVGLYASMQDSETDAVRTRLLNALSAAAKTKSITVMKAKLEYQVDMYWEGALVVMDEETKQILFAVGGYGT